MVWTKETVEARLIRYGLSDAFIEKGGVLKLCVCRTHLLFIANNDNTVSVYYEYIPANMEVVCCVDEFCSHAIPYLSKRLAERSENMMLSPYCIEPIYID